MKKKPIVVNKCSLVLCLLLVLLQPGCGNGTPPEEPEIENLPEVTVPELTETVPDTSEEEVLFGMNMIHDGSIEEKFIEEKHLYFYDGWIYYNNSDMEARKCRLDLTQDMLAFPGGSHLKLNQDGYGLLMIYQDGFYIFDANNGIAEAVSLPAYYSRILYKNYIFGRIETIVNGFHEYWLEMYDLKDNIAKTIFPETLFDFAVVDDSVYYLPYYGNDDKTMPGSTIMRYDINSGETEKVFEFEMKGYYHPKAHFNNRTILIQYDSSSFVYTSIDEIAPKAFEIEIDRSIEYFEVIPSTDDDIYLVLRHGNEGYSDDTPPDWFRIAHGSTEPVLLKGFDMDGSSYPAYFSDGYLYYFGLKDSRGNYALKREHFFDYD